MRNLQRHVQPFQAGMVALVGCPRLFIHYPPCWRPSLKTHRTVMTRETRNMAPYFYVPRLPALFSAHACSCSALFFCTHLPALLCRACSCHPANGSIISKPILNLICDSWIGWTFFHNGWASLSYFTLFIFPQRNCCHLCHKGETVHIHKHIYLCSV
jgi:hypothetical protein